MKGAHNARLVLGRSSYPGEGRSRVGASGRRPFLASRLETVHERGAKILALEIEERHTLLQALETGPASTALAELRGVLLAEHVGRVRDGSR